MHTIWVSLGKLLPDARIFYPRSHDWFSFVWYCSYLFWSEKKIWWIQAMWKSLFWSSGHDIYILPYAPSTYIESNFSNETHAPNMQIFTDVDALYTDGFWWVDDTLEAYAWILWTTNEVLFLPEDAWSLNDLLVETKYDILTYWLKPDQETDVWFSWYVYKEDDTLWITSHFIVEQGDDDTQLRVCSHQLWYMHAAYISLWYEIWCILSRRLSFQLNTLAYTDACIWNTVVWWTHIYDGNYWSVLLHARDVTTPSEMWWVCETAISLRQKFHSDKELVYCVCLEEGYIWTHTEYAYRQLAATFAQSWDEVHLVWDILHRFTYDEMIKLWYDDIAIYLHASKEDMMTFLGVHIWEKQRCSCIVFAWCDTVDILKKHR